MFLIPTSYLNLPHLKHALLMPVVLFYSRTLQYDVD